MFPRCTRLLAAVLILACTSGCTTIKALSLARGGEAADGKDFSDTITFAEEGHLILVKTAVNGSAERYNFILDTGAFTVVTERLAKDLKLDGGTGFEGRDPFGGTRKVRIVRLDRIRLGNIEVRQPAAVVFDLEKIQPHFQTRIDGIIGSNVLRFFTLAIDYGKRRVVLSRGNGKKTGIKGAVRLNFSQEMSHGYAPCVELRMNNKVTVRGIIDTGAPFSLMVPYSVYEKSGASKDRLIGYTGSFGGGAFKAAGRMHLARIDVISLGPLSLEKFPALVGDPDSRYGNCLIGRDFLSRFVVILDYPAGELTLVPAGGKFPQNIFSTGLGLKKEGSAGAFVAGFFRNSPAEKAGLMPGDEVMRINGKRTRDLSQAKIRRMLDDESIESFELVIKRNGRTRKIRLKKEMLFPAD